MRFSWLVSHEGFFAVMKNKLPITKYLEIIKGRSNVQEKNMLCERVLNFEQWKTFSEKANESLVFIYLEIYRELLSLVPFLWVHSNLKEVSYLSWQNTYPNLKTTCHIKLKFFLWTKLLENLVLAKCLISVNAPLLAKVERKEWSYLKHEISCVRKKREAKCFRLMR